MKKIFINDLAVIKILAVLLLVVGFNVTDYGATFTVTKTADTNDGACDADCSLREAVIASNTAASDDVIIFDASVFGTSQTIVLTGGAITISGSSRLTIEGTGSNLLAIDCSVNSGINNNSSAIVIFKNFKVTGDSSGFSGRIANTGNLTLSNLIIMNSPYGTAAVSNGGTMTIENSTFTGNMGGAISNNDYHTGNTKTLLISNSNISSNGIGVSNDRGRLTITDSTISNNIYRGIYNSEGTANLSNLIITGNSYSGFNNDGAGVYAYTSSESDAMTAITNITNSLISGNSVRGENSDGGGVASINSILTITNSTVSGNSTANGDGGGIWVSGTFNLYNSTVTGNTAQLNGGGIYSLSTTNLSSSTINGNTAVRGGGVYNGIGQDDVVSTLNTIIGDNTATESSPDFFGTLTSQGYNLIENTGGTNITGNTAGNIIGQDPQLVPLRSNGGATPTVALLATSPAVDTGDPNNSPATDQRGIARPQDGDLNGSTLPDIGAYERQVSAVLTVTKTSDTNDGTCDTDCSLREAVAALNSSSATDKAVVFDPGTFSTAQTITLTLGQLPITNADGTSFIKGTGSDLLTFSGNNTSRVFSVGSGVALAVTGLTVAQGNPFDGSQGGGILNRGTLALNSVTLRNNRAVDGGAIRNLNGILNINNSTINNNQLNDTSGAGGGIRSDGGNVNITNSFINNNNSGSAGGILNYFTSTMTISNTAVNNNAALGYGGGGIQNLGVLTINNSSVSDNSSQGFGAIDHSFGTLTITNSNINNNTGGGGGGIAHFNGGTILITNSTVSRNKALTAGFGTGGGGILIGENCVVTVYNSTVSGNSTAAEGGGIAVFLGTFNATNSTISDNAAANTGGIENYQGTVNLINATVAFNFAGSGAGGVRKFNNSGSVNARNSIISNNTAGSPISVSDFTGTLNSQGYNLIGNTNGAVISGSTIGNIININSRLDPVLRGNGGTTLTHALRNGSPAIDKGSLSTNITTDQRGLLRPFDFPSVPNASGGNGSDIGAFEKRTNDIDRVTYFDFDGDGKSDLSVFRPENGAWYLNQSTNGFTGITFGYGTDKLVPADYDGDGKTDIAVYRGGTWYLQQSSFGFTGITFGDANDIPVPADYDGDGKTDIAVFRPSNGTWYLQRSQLGFTGIVFGQNGDKPIPADYDGDGKTDVAVNRNGTWYLNRSTQGFYGVPFGDGNDRLVPADYDGDGKTDIAVFRPSNGTWYLLQSTAGFTGVQFGLGTDIPVAADYDGDGKADIAVVRNGNWYLNRSTQGFTGVAFGASTDNPLPNVFVR